MPARRRSRNMIVAPSATAVPSTPPADPRLDDLLLPASGPNAVPPEKMTPRERVNEIVGILARGLLRKMAGIPPPARPSPDGAATAGEAPPHGWVT